MSGKVQSGYVPEPHEERGEPSAVTKNEKGKKWRITKMAGLHRNQRSLGRKRPGGPLKPASAINGSGPQ